MSTIAYNQTVADHARMGVEAEYLLLKDSESFKLGIADKAFRMSYLVGAIGGILQADDAKAADILSRAAPLLKDAEAKAKAKRAAAVKLGTIVERTDDEQRVYMTATKRFSRFCATHSIKPANKARGSASKGEAPKPAKDATPAGLTQANATAYVKMQAAVMKAYAEKNKDLLPESFRFLMLEFATGIDDASKYLPEAETK
jgi:hypothetical protein